MSALLLIATAALASPARAQIGASQLKDGPYEPTISPRSGPPGTEVTFRASQLPPSTTMLVGVGVVGGGGYEMVGEGESDAAGNLSLEVRVPAWAQPGTSHYFFVAYADQRPRAMADAFLVSDAAGVVTLNGVITLVAAGCIGMKQDSDPFTLLGEALDVRVGERVRLTATVAEGDVDTCAGGLPLRVRTLDVR